MDKQDLTRGNPNDTGNYYSRSRPRGGCAAPCRPRNAKLLQKYKRALGAQEGLKTAEDSDRENLLFNQIVSYEKRADFDTAKSLMADFLAAYPENTAAQRENTFLQNR